MLMQRVKPLSRILAQGSDAEHGLKRSLGPWALTAMGIGAIIGTGIFVLTGVASANTVWRIRASLAILCPPSFVHPMGLPSAPFPYMPLLYLKTVTEGMRCTCLTRPPQTGS